MFDYLDKFKKLPAEVQAKVSNSEKVKIISALEAKYRQDLAVFTVKVVVGEFPINDLGIHIAEEFSLVEDQAKALAKDLKEKVFLDIADFLQMDLRGLDKKLVAAYLESKKPKAKKVILALPKKEEKKLLEKPETTPQFTEKTLFPLPLLPKKNDAFSRKVAEAISDLSEIIQKESLISDRMQLIKAREILRLYLRGVKSRHEARHFFKNDLNLDQHQTEIILKAGTIAKRNLSPLPKRPLLNVSAVQKNTTKVYDLKKVLDHQDDFEIKKVLPANKPLKVDKPLVLDKMMAPDKKKVSEPEKKVTVVKTPPPVVSTPSSPKQKFHDIAEVKIMNPIDELRYMDAQTFRRLGITPQEATEKIFSRFKALEKEDFEKKLAGISAWRESPLNNLYLKMTSLSTETGKSVDDLAKDMKAKKEDFLSAEEINAIIVLNRSLRF